MNFKHLFQAELAAQEYANAIQDRVLIYKPFNRDSYELIRWTMRGFDELNYVGECAPASWEF